MTEEEAKTKWCPFARVDGWYAGHNTFNRVLPDGPSDQWAERGKAATICIGSGCMAWRRVVEEVSGSDTDGFDYVRTEVTGGYCGLAGRPE